MRTQEQIDKHERIKAQIDQEQQTVSFDTKELTVELYVSKYLNDIEKDDNELYVPDYQREFVWDDKHQSRFIESLILGLPVPFIFAAEIKDTGRLEIVDGSQRIRTLAAFLNNELKLTNLQKLKELNELKFSDLPSAQQRMFKNISIRMVVLSAQATEDVRNELFDRINTSSVPLLPMETRRGIYRGKFTDFISELAKDEKFKSICPISKYFEKRREEEELALRYFAFLDAYPYYSKVESMGVAKYLDEYLDQKNKTLTDAEKEQKKEEFQRMVDFIDRVYPGQGFSKKQGVTGVSKPYFEALAIGVTLALRERPELPVGKEDGLIVDKKHRNEFSELVEGRYRTHTAKKILGRIDYVKNTYLS